MTDDRSIIYNNKTFGPNFLNDDDDDMLSPIGKKFYKKKLVKKNLVQKIQDTQSDTNNFSLHQLVKNYSFYM